MFVQDLRVYGLQTPDRIQGGILQSCLWVFCFFFFTTGVWSLGLYREPLHQPFFVMGIFEIRSHKLFAQVGFQTSILLSS
jgi:hypothetical protein